MVMVDVMRGGPGLGNIAPSQGDYFQIVKGGGHGDYHPIVLAPATVQEAVDLTYQAFDLAHKYRWIVVILLDGSIGQMMEPAVLPPMREPANGNRPDWALTGRGTRDHHNVISSIYLQPAEEEAYNRHIQAKLADIRASEVRFEEFETEDADVIVVGFGTAGRISLTAVRLARERGYKVGLLRPISLYPFPSERLSQLAESSRAFLTVEMNAGQMVEDVRLAVQGAVPVDFLGRMGGMLPLPDEITDRIVQLCAGSGKEKE